MRLHLVIPAHNEEERIDRTLHDYRAATMPFDLRILVALDDCRDATAAVVARHGAEDSRIALVEYPKLGKGGVLREAFRLGEADVIGFVDADGSTPPAEIVRLAVAAMGADGAIASRRHPAALTPVRRSVARRTASTMFAGLVGGLFRLPFADTQCGAKVFRAAALRQLLPLLSSRDFLFDLDLLVTARRLGMRVVEVPSIWIDRDGSKVHALSDAPRMAAGSLVLWLHHQLQPQPQIPVDLSAAEPAPALTVVDGAADKAAVRAS